MNQIGEELYQLAGEIFPICRSLTGNGVRETFEILKKYIHGLEIFEIPSGKKVFDWVVPNEWSIREAYIEDSKGQRIIDFHKNNLHVMCYSIPVDKWVDLSELEQYETISSFV